MSLWWLTVVRDVRVNDVEHIQCHTVNTNREEELSTLNWNIICHNSRLIFLYLVSCNLYQSNRCSYYCHHPPSPGHSLMFWLLATNDYLSQAVYPDALGCGVLVVLYPCFFFFLEKSSFKCFSLIHHARMLEHWESENHWMIDSRVWSHRFTVVLTSDPTCSYLKPVMTRLCFQPWHDYCY